VEVCRAADAILLGAVGGPKWDSPSAAIRPEQGLLGIRKALGFFANLRPIVAEPRLAKASPNRAELLAGVDMMIVRELTGGIYFGAKSCEPTTTGERATDLCAYTTEEIARITRVAADLARRRRRRLTSVDKANVLETSRLWRRVVTKIMAEEYPDIQVEHMLVDAFAMRLIQQPAALDVVVTANMFGDILTDEAAVLAGSIGVLPSASLGGVANGTRSHGLYEPIHGSAPMIAGRGIANPIGAILSAAMLLRHSLGLEAEAVAVERAVSATIRDEILTPDIPAAGRRAASTREVAANVASRIRSAKQSRSRTEQRTVRAHSPL
jgi:3-isopropylmalate dehydrogenase